MRFVDNGPNIPDDLLYARDQGRVVFFCGAGVSRAKAKLPDFFGLAKLVVEDLGVLSDDPAMRLLNAAQDPALPSDVGPLISADRIFGLLERNFQTADIRAAVVKSLAYDDAVDVSAHQTLLKLARTQGGKTRLVTTNFDRLFDRCGITLESYLPPRLPDPHRASDFDGVVYLHGKASANSLGAEGDGFVLSSSEFGRAYLSEGWATAFVQNILNQFDVVFIGYSADDPPVQYLLEALNRSPSSAPNLFAFQSGDQSAATGRWRHKGVSAIAYDAPSHDHSALWDTLDAWAERAHDPDGWMDQVIDKARAGPETLEPHERGQLAHIVSSQHGARRFAAAEPPAPAEWLCVFDPSRRYASPGRLGFMDANAPIIDPFPLFSLDGDAVPNPTDPDDPYRKREVPSGAWDAFNINAEDRASIGDDSLARLRGHSSKRVPHLPKRIGSLGVWLTRVAEQPAAVWWAAQQNSLHPDLMNQIDWQLRRDDTDAPTAVELAWQHLFEAWDAADVDEHRDWFELNRDLSRHGWNGRNLRRFAHWAKPKIRTRQSFGNGPVLGAKEEYSVNDMMDLDVHYPDLPTDLHVPDEHLAVMLDLLRKNLEVAVSLEREIGGHGLSSLSPIRPDSDPNISAFSRAYALSGWMLHYVSQFERLMGLDIHAAKAELTRWPIDDQTLFARLKMWAIGEATLTPASDIGDLLDTVADEAFWNSYNSRDLMLSLAARWSDFNSETQAHIEKRLLAGPPRWQGESDAEFEERQAWSVLQRLTWLDDQGLGLQVDVTGTTNELIKLAPDWKPHFARGAIRSYEGRSGTVETVTEHDALLNIPISSILARAAELAGRDHDSFESRDPFAGLVAAHPVRAFAALRRAAATGDYPTRAWSSFFRTDLRKTDKPRFTGFIAEQLSRYPAEALTPILYDMASWAETSAKTLATDYPDLFARLFNKIIDALTERTKDAPSSVIRRRVEIDWTMEAINSAAGKVAMAMLDDPQWREREPGAGLPSSWRSTAERLLNLHGELRRYALVVFSGRLSWFFSVDPDWTNTHLLSVLNAEELLDRQAFWAGVLWRQSISGRELFDRLKPHLMALAKSDSPRKHHHTQALAGFILSAWHLVDEETGEKWVTNEEMRDVLLHGGNAFRCQVLWLAERWMAEKDADWGTLLLELLNDVWPKHLSAKSAEVSARMCDIAFSDEAHFPELVQAILKHATSIDRHDLRLPNLRSSQNTVVEKHPRDALALLAAVLPLEASSWPYGVDTAIDRIGEADRSLNQDQRLIELRRRWARR